MIENFKKIAKISFETAYDLIQQGVEKMNELTAEKIIEVRQTFNDKIFIQRGDNIESILLFKPENKDSLLIIFSNGEKLRITYSVLMRALRNEAKELYQKYKNLDLFMKISKKDEDFIKDFNKVYDVDLEFSQLNNFVDITDNLFNNFNQINRSTLQSQGLWLGNGVRQIKLDYNVEEFLSLSDNSESKKLTLLINKKNNDLINQIEFPIKNNILYLNTDEFKEIMEETDKEADFYGYVVTKIEKDNYEFFQYSNFSIKIINPLFIVEDKDVASIDFGTSSTCVAINKGKDLVAFTDNPETIEDYENQSAIIVFNWRKIYNEWGVKSRTIPHFNRSKNSVEKVDILKEHFNYSNYIKEELKEAPTTKTVDAIISDLKSLPAKLSEDRENKDSIKPFDNFKNKLFLTDEIDEESDECLNPIALYAYFIGRSLNVQSKNKPYIRYELTMPVKFNERLRNSLKDSIEYGLKRSLPFALKDRLEVRIGFDESVALIGAAKRLKHFKFKNYDKEVFLFAVFDFGGGTLDFSFGLFRKYLTDDRAILEREEKYRDIVEIFGTDGMKLGGEKLIEKLSYFIYKENKEIMKENNIPIFIPEGEQKIIPYPDHLTGNRHIDRLNLRNINERISRDFFINGECENTTVNLFAVDDEINEQEITLRLDKGLMEDFLNEKVLEAVENFKKVLIETFKKYKERISEFGFEDFDLGEVRIFQAGNTCKSQWVENAFNDIFKEHQNIIFLEDKNAKDEFTKITVKNAVAKGALFLEGSGYYDHTKNEEGLMPLDRYIWNYDDILEDEEDAEPILKSAETQKDKEFSFIGVANSDNYSFTIYYSHKRNIEDVYDDDLLNHNIKIPEDLMDEDNCFVYVKPYDGKVIEVAIGDSRDCDGSSLEGSLLLNLDTGNFEVKNG